MTTTNTTAQIATFLNVSFNQIKSVTELFYVFCVVVKGQRARFVSKKVVKQEDVKVLKMQVTLGGDWLCLAEIDGDRKCLILRSNNVCSLASEMAVRDITTQVKGKTLEWMCNQHFDTFHNVPTRSVPAAVRTAYYSI